MASPAPSVYEWNRESCPQCSRVRQREYRGCRVWLCVSQDFLRLYQTCYQRSFRHTPCLRASVAELIMFDDVRKIGVMEWEERMPAVPEAYRAECTYLRSLVPGGVRYLFSPFEYSCRGDTLLRRLNFDSSLAALRLWAFIFSEKDRLFLAKEKGWKVFAAMKDLGPVPVLTYAVPDSLTFYADELWWAPCFAEEQHLLDEAARLGAGEELCFVRAALGRDEDARLLSAARPLHRRRRRLLRRLFRGHAIDRGRGLSHALVGDGAPGSSLRRSSRRNNSCARPAIPPTCLRPMPLSPVSCRGILRRLEELTGDNDHRAHAGAKQDAVQRDPGKDRGAARPGLRGATASPARPRDAPCGVHRAPRLLRTGRGSARAGRSFKDRKGQDPPGHVTALLPIPIRIFWVTPPTDAALITLLENLGGCIAGTEYMISHAFFPLAGGPIRRRRRGRELHGRSHDRRHGLPRSAHHRGREKIPGRGRHHLGHLRRQPLRLRRKRHLPGHTEGAGHSCPFLRRAVFPGQAERPGE